MSTLQIPDRPAFNSLEPGLDSDLTPPISSLAVVAMVLGIFSLTGAITVSVVPFAIVVALLCAILTWKLSRDRTLGGLRLTQIGLCCAIMGSTWGLTAMQLTKTYYYAQAGEYAKLFLQTLSAGNQFDAFELMLPESTRQVTGTDVEAHYTGLMGATNEMAIPKYLPEDDNMQGPSALDKLKDFLASLTTKDILSHGKDAEWKFVRGEEIVRVNSNQDRISVVMVDTANPSKKFRVSMNRVINQMVSKPGMPAVAIWDVDSASAAKE